MTTDTPPSEQHGRRAQLQGLPLSELMGGPLVAALEAQTRLAMATADFIRTVGFMPPSGPDGVAEARTAAFAFSRAIPDDSAPSGVRQEQVQMDVPLLSLVNVPSLQIDNMDIAFDVTVTAWTPASGSQPPAIEAVLADANPTLRAPGYAITMKVVSAAPTDAMGRVMDEMTNAVTPIVKPR